MTEIFNKLNKPRFYLLLANVLLVFFLILLSNLGFLPVKKSGDFIFFTLVYLAFALYRPGWSFLFFIGVIALENISLAPTGIGIAVRPYQFAGGLTILAVMIKMAAGRLGFKLPKFGWYDFLFLIFAAAGFLSALGASDKSIALKQSVVALSFVALYFLARTFIKTFDDLKRVVPFFLSSSFVVMLYGLWQNWRFLNGKNPFETMPGRPNATFTEPDWLGIFLVFLLAVFYALIYNLRTSKIVDDQEIKINNYKLFYLHACLVLIFSLIIITVSRSAWLGAFVVTFAYLFIIWTNLNIQPKDWQWKFAFRNKIGILGTFLFAIALIFIFHLTNFQLFNRAQSTASGLQKITVSCAQKTSLPEKISTVSELSPYGCRHINLEEIRAEKERGYFVSEIFRSDPNFNIRGQIYQKSWEQIIAHPILGIGWGNIGKILGTDENGNALNSSNIFLETWLGAGILGFLSFIAALIFVFINGIRNFQGNSKAKVFGLFLTLGLAALVVPNLFNAGILLGFFWIFLALANIKEIA